MKTTVNKRSRNGTSLQSAPPRWYARVGASQLELGNVEGLCQPER